MKQLEQQLTDEDPFPEPPYRCRLLVASSGSHPAKSCCRHAALVLRGRRWRAPRVAGDIRARRWSPTRAGVLGGAAARPTLHVKLPKTRKMLPLACRAAAARPLSSTPPPLEEEGPRQSSPLSTTLSPAAVADAARARR